MKGRPSGSKNKVLHIWNDEEKEYLKKITSGHHYAEIQKMINKKFDLNLTINQIKGAISRYKLNTGFTGHLPKGNIPHNKGMKGIYAKGSEKTWFKKGQIPFNHKSVGSERITKDGYIEIKIAESNKWRLKHQLVWEKYNGLIPQKHVVIFADGDKRNFDIKNLILISRSKLLIMNKNKLIYNNAELTKTGIVIASIQEKIRERKRR
ncbi:HNH endonuclease [Clostridium botulinum]|uniref:Phage protein n=1 Tax=Clostridium botulinum (strain Eklund 17B / Type B) TaxID=935198 RepID=B2TP02_CLOBB|nr:phage protein [Clostridium botulinum B str. Eklund 17B (NRP)]MBY6976271.1 HNH endonuclease [Clostridium botulinum]MBY7000696.1 HNH endonuclease [Clostridium botulinum]MCR1273460.1 HNH endonuclease [Clostridium botulinum]NFD71284.1 HNH endonuclease [Clostridium botulinum]